MDNRNTVFTIFSEKNQKKKKKWILLINFEEKLCPVILFCIIGKAHHKMKYHFIKYIILAHKIPVRYFYFFTDACLFNYVFNRNFRITLLKKRSFTALMVLCFNTCSCNVFHRTFGKNSC